MIYFIHSSTLCHFKICLKSHTVTLLGQRLEESLLWRFWRLRRLCRRWNHGSLYNSLTLGRSLRIRWPISHYNPPALLLPTVLVNIIVVVVYFYRRLRIRYPEFILVVKIVLSEARYKTLHSTNHGKLSEWVGVVDTASSYEQEGREFESRLLFYFFFFTLFS